MTKSTKFTELAAGIKRDLKNFDQQADELMAKRETLRLRGEKVFAIHRERQAGFEEGLKAMEEAVSELEGSNSGNSQEGSEDTSEASFRSSETTAKTPGS